jgi:hypothetical protein
MTTTTTKSPDFTTSQLENFFGELIHDFKVDKMQLETGVATKEKSEFYKSAITGDTDSILKKLREEANKNFIFKIISSFVTELKTRKAIPPKLAFSLTPATIMVWAEINDDDEEMENAILLSEAKINSEAKEFDFSIDTMVVEKSDCLKVPSHYTTLKA